MDAQQVKSQYLEFCRAGKVIQADEDTQVLRLAVALQQHLKEGALGLVKRAGKQPVLFSYSSDATSLLCQSVARESTGELVVVRSGKVLHELLMQRGIVKTTSSTGKGDMALLYHPPVPLTSGKSVWHLFGAGCKFFPLLREVGHPGIVLYHVVADRAVQKPLERMFSQRAQAYYTPGLGPDLGPESSLLEASDLFLSTGCAAHDGHNSLKWALGAAAEVELLKDMHIIVESLRKSFSLLHRHLHHFLAQKLVFRSAPPCSRIAWLSFGNCWE